MQNLLTVCCLSPVKISFRSELTQICRLRANRLSLSCRSLLLLIRHLCVKVSSSRVAGFLLPFVMSLCYTEDDLNGSYPGI